MKQNQTVASAGGTAVSTDGLEPDPLRSLHKMSTTAGVASQEYVAINTAAVWTAALGVASLFALIDPILLVIPLAAVIFGFVALHQIKDSNGTETGRSWAWLGLIFALGVGGQQLYKQFSASRQSSSDEQTIAQLVQQFGENVKAGKFDDAYAMFSDTFKQKVDHDQFLQHVRQVQTTTLYGNLQKTEWNQKAIFGDFPEQNLKMAETLMLMYFEKAPEPIRQGVGFRRVEGKWYIDNIPDLFPPTPKGEAKLAA